MQNHRCQGSQSKIMNNDLRYNWSVNFIDQPVYNRRWGSFSCTSAHYTSWRHSQQPKNHPKIYITIEVKATIKHSYLTSQTSGNFVLSKPSDICCANNIKSSLANFSWGEYCMLQQTIFKWNKITPEMRIKLTYTDINHERIKNKPIYNITWDVLLFFEDGYQICHL